MNFQIIFVICCVGLAIAFMARKVYRVLHNRGGCDCECNTGCENEPACTHCGGGQKKMKEIRPR